MVLRILITSAEQGTTVNPFFLLIISTNPHKNAERKELLLSQFFRQGNQGPESFNDLIVQIKACYAAALGFSPRLLALGSLFSAASSQLNAGKLSGLVLLGRTVIESCAQKVL